MATRISFGFIFRFNQFFVTTKAQKKYVLHFSLEKRKKNDLWTRVIFARIGKNDEIVRYSFPYAIQLSIQILIAIIYIRLSHIIWHSPLSLTFHFPLHGLGLISIRCFPRFWFLACMKNFIDEFSRESQATRIFRSQPIAAHYVARNSWPSTKLGQIWFSLSQRYCFRIHYSTAAKKRF